MSNYNRTYADYNQNQVAYKTVNIQCPLQRSVPSYALTTVPECPPPPPPSPTMHTQTLPPSLVWDTSLPPANVEQAHPPSPVWNCPPEVRDPCSEEYMAGDPYVADPYMAEPYVADPYMADPYMADPYMADPYLVDQIDYPISEPHTPTTVYRGVHPKPTLVNRRRGTIRSIIETGKQMPRVAKAVWKISKTKPEVVPVPHHVWETY